MAFFVFLNSLFFLDTIFPFVVCCMPMYLKKKKKTLGWKIYIFSLWTFHSKIWMEPISHLCSHFQHIHFLSFNLIFIHQHLICFSLEIHRKYFPAKPPFNVNLCVNSLSACLMVLLLKYFDLLVVRLGVLWFLLRTQSCKNLSSLQLSSTFLLFLSWYNCVLD